MAKRDIIAEVLARRSRQLKRTPRLQQTHRRIINLRNAFSLLRKHGIPLECRQELYRYFPIALTAISEGHMRMLYRDLINSGEPFMSRGANFKDLRIDCGTLVATATNRVTVGELIAHQLPHNNLGDIEFNLSQLLDEDFSAKFQKDLVNEGNLGGHKVFRTYLRQSVVETFKQRHIFCHELALPYTPSQRQIESSSTI